MLHITCTLCNRKVPDEDDFEDDDFDWCDDEE